MHRRRIWFILAVLAAVFFSQSCGNAGKGGSRNRDSYTTDCSSTEFKNKDKKLAFLRKYLDMPSDVKDAEYHIDYQDNSKGLVPGPSEWEIRAAVQVEEKDIPLWTKDMKKILPRQVDVQWWEDLKTPSFTWAVPEDALYYKRPESQSYLVVCPDTGIILKFISTTYMPKEAVPNDPFKAAAAQALGYDGSTASYIETVREMNLRTATGEATDIVCLKAMFYDSPAYGIPVLAVRTGGNIDTQVLCDGSYEEKYYLADVTGDGVDELLASQCISITGGAGAYETEIFQLDGENPLKTLFKNPDETGETFDTGFSIHLSENYVCTVDNGYTGSRTVFTHSSLKDSPYYDQAGNLTDEGRDYNQADLLETDPYFFIFEPVDIDGDGVYEIKTVQYSYLWGRADGLGNACAILHWGNGYGFQPLYVQDSKFISYDQEGQEDDSGYDWYKEKPQQPGDNMDPEEMRRQVCKLIENMDFSTKQYPLKDGFPDSEADRKYREAYYQVVTQQKPVLCRKLRSFDYEEKYFPDILNDDPLNGSTYLSYMDYDGDGLPELMVLHMGVYGFKYDPAANQVYLFLDEHSSYVHLWGAGQIYWYNPCLANKEIYSYSYEDRNGNREGAGFKSEAEWDNDRGDWKERYYVCADEYPYVEVSTREWNRLFGRLKAGQESYPAFMSLEEFTDFARQPPH